MANPSELLSKLSSAFYLFGESSLCLLVIWVGMTLTCVAQNVASPSGQAPSAEATITGYEKQLSTAWSRRDIDTVRHLLTDEFMLV